MRRLTKRRSGNAVVEYAQLLGWEPSHVVLVGVGHEHAETDVMREEWGDGFELYGFEPNPRIYEGIQSTFPGRLYNRGVWSSECQKELWVKPRWKDGSSFCKSTENPEVWAAITVQCQTLDRLMFDLCDGSQGNWDKGVLWLDCEGSELEALRGAEQFIETIEVVNVELTSLSKGENWCKPYEVHQWLIEHDFLQAYIHTIRPFAGQRDMIYLRKSIWNRDLTSIF